MEYIKGKPYFCRANEQIKAYPYLTGDVSTDILIIGGGIDGAIANYYLSKFYDVMLCDKARLGHGCTTCATALLEYQLDDFADELKGTLSENEIVSIYKMGLASIQKIEDFVKEHGNNCEFSRRPTFMYSNSLFGIKAMKKEFEFRKKHGFNVRFIDENNNSFPFLAKAGVYAPDGGCEFNPYLFTKQMIESSQNQDKIFENTCIAKIDESHNGFIAHTNYGEKIFAKKIIISTGFNWELINQTNLCERFISYTIVTKPIENFSWHERALIQDDKDPYHYLRLLPDNRIIYGGEDTKFKGKPIKESLARKKYEKLLKDLKLLFPDISDQIIVEHQFCGAFGSTKNNLGHIGETKIPNLFYFFSMGANGIINAMYGAELIRNILENKPDKLEAVFSPKRI